MNAVPLAVTVIVAVVALASIATVIVAAASHDAPDRSDRRRECRRRDRDRRRCPVRRWLAYPAAGRSGRRAARARLARSRRPCGAHRTAHARARRLAPRGRLGRQPSPSVAPHRNTGWMPLSPAERREVTALRLAAQRHRATRLRAPEDVVRHLLAMQAQDFPGAKWSVGLRVPSSTDASVDAAIADRRIARSWPMRGTLHFVAPEDLRWMLALSAPRLRNSSAKRHRRAGDHRRAPRVTARRIAESLVRPARWCAATTLLAAFEAAGIPTDGQRSVPPALEPRATTA